MNVILRISVNDVAETLPDTTGCILFSLYDGTTAPNGIDLAILAQYCPTIWQRMVERGINCGRQTLFL
jgi:hypothetical protein